MTFVVIIITFVVRTKAKAKANAIVKIRTKGQKGKRSIRIKNTGFISYLI